MCIRDRSSLALIGPAAVGLGIVFFVFILAGPRDEDSASVLRNRLRSYGDSEGVEGKKGVLRRVFGVFSRGAEEAVRRRGLLTGAVSYTSPSPRDRTRSR